MKFKGGNIEPDGSNYSDYSGVLSADDNHLHDKDDSSIDCGSMNLSEMSVETAADTGFRGIKMTPIGANFTMDNNIESKATGGLECEGALTLTLVLNY